MLRHKNYCEISQELQIFNRHDFLTRVGRVEPALGKFP
jgi:hypothetical protein